MMVSFSSSSSTSDSDLSIIRPAAAMREEISLPKDFARWVIVHDGRPWMIHAAIPRACAAEHQKTPRSQGPERRKLPDGPFRWQYSGRYWNRNSVVDKDGHVKIPRLQSQKIIFGESYNYFSLNSKSYIMAIPYNEVFNLHDIAWESISSPADQSFNMNHPHYTPIDNIDKYLKPNRWYDIDSDEVQVAIVETDLYIVLLNSMLDFKEPCRILDIEKCKEIVSLVKKEQEFRSEIRALLQRPASVPMD